MKNNSGHVLLLRNYIVRRRLTTNNKIMGDYLSINDFSNVRNIYLIKNNRCFLCFKEFKTNGYYLKHMKNKICAVKINIF